MAESDHILLLTSEYPPFLWGGVGRYVIEVEQALRAAGDTPIICCIPSYALGDRPDHSSGGSAFTVQDPEFAACFQGEAFDLATYSAHCERLANRLLSDLPSSVRTIFLQDFYLVGVAEVISGRMPMARRCYFAHLPLSARFTYFEKSISDETQQALEARAILWSDRVCVASAFARRTICAVYPIMPDRIATIPLAADFPARGTVIRDPNLITSIGRFTQQKGWEAVIDVIRRLEQAKVQGRYAIVGTGIYREAVTSMMQTLLPADRLALHDRLEPRQELPALLAQSAVFLQLSAYETFGLAALEAAFQGAVPVVSAVGAVAELFPSESGAILVTPGDTAAAADAVARLLADTGAAAERSRRLRHHAAQFRWSDHAARLRASWRVEHGVPS